MINAAHLLACRCSCRRSGARASRPRTGPSACRAGWSTTATTGRWCAAHTELRGAARALHGPSSSSALAVSLRALSLSVLLHSPLEFVFGFDLVLKRIRAAHTCAREKTH
eukprot:5841450-Pleurochrysis_carterae.AAC.1